MNELKLRKLIGSLIREVLNYPHPSQLPEDIRKARNDVLREDAASIPAKVKEAVAGAAKELIETVGTGGLDDAQARPPKILENQPPGDEP